MVADMGIMRNMYAFVQETTITDNRLSFRIRSTVDHNIFTDHIVIADNGQRSVTLIFEILRLCCNHCPVEHAIVLA